jgi:hypothetical protein
MSTGQRYEEGGPKKPRPLVSVIIDWMTPRERRLRAVTRVVRLGEDDGAFDREFWGRVSPGERVEAVWGLALEYMAWRGEDAGEPRLQRSVCRVERRRG